MQVREASPSFRLQAFFGHVNNTCLKQSFKSDLHYLLLGHLGPTAKPEPDVPLPASQWPVLLIPTTPSANLFYKARTSAEILLRGKKKPNQKNQTKKPPKKPPSRYNIWLYCSWMQNPTSPFWHEAPKNNSSLKKSGYFYTVTRITGLLLIIPSFLGMSICAQHNWLRHQWNHNTSQITGNWEV